MPFRIGVPELLLISVICCIPILVVWLIVKSTSKRPNPPIAGSTISSAVDKTASEKLAELKKLLDGNLISQEEYNSKKAEIIKQL